MPPGWGQFDVDALPEDPRGLSEAPAMDRSAVLEVASARLFDGTVIQVGKSSEAREELLSRFRTIVMLVTGAVILVGLAGGLVFTRSTLQPVTALASVVRDIVATGRTDSRVPVRETGDALDELSRSFNAMLDRIGALITGMSQFFVGVVIVAIIGNAAEHYSAIVLAGRNQMDAAISIAIGSSNQIALLVAPLLVFLSYLVGPHPMDLVFTTFELVAVAVSVLSIAFIAHDGESNWMEGVQLLAVYAILALAFFFLPVR